MKQGVLAALVLLSFVYAASAYASTMGFREHGYIGEMKNETEFKDYIMTVGEATVSVDASVMIADLNFVGRGKTAKLAYNQQKEVMENVIEYLKKNGVTETETSSLLIEPIYGEAKDDADYHSDYSKITSYKVGSTLTIKVRNMSLFDSILVDATDMGVNEITNLRFIPNASQIAEAKNKVRQLALKNAKENALWQATSINRTLGDMTYIGDPTTDLLQNGGYYWGYRNSQMVYNTMAQTAVYLGTGNVGEVESMSPGRVTYKATVTVGYTL